jgi:hypothetical protein
MPRRESALFRYMALFAMLSSLQKPLPIAIKCFV